jgi:type IV pilus assembly protein PilC
MALFEFTAKDNLGNSKSGTVEAKSQDDALLVLKNQSLIVISIREKHASFGETLISFGGVKFEDVVEFSREFSTMINSGLTITKSLQICLEQSANPSFKKILSEIAKDVDSGTSLSGALARFPLVFDSSYTALIKAGESSGKLDSILSRIAETYEANRDLKSRLQSALIYPAIILIVMIGVILLLIVYVVPKLTEIFKTLDKPLPWHTQFLINLSNAIINYWLIFILVIGASALFLRIFLTSQEGKAFMSALLFKMPVIGKILKQTELSNYMRILSLLIGSGVQITEALIISAKVSSNQTIVNASLEASRYVEKGSNLSDYFRSNKFFDPIISSMVKIGEETGKVDELLNKVAENYSNESGYAIKGLSSAIEPIILIVLGISVGGIILSVITPIYSIIGTVGGL